MTHEDYIKQTMCQVEYMQQAKCYPCNKPSVTTHEKYMQQAKSQENTSSKPSVTYAIN